MKIDGNTALKLHPNSLPQVIVDILADAEHKPQTYLKETVVPKGGE